MTRGLPPGAILEARYRIDAFYAHGGMAAVYQATDLRLDRPVAVKVMNATGTGDASFRRRFSREAQALARFVHPHIVAIHDFGETPQGLPFLVMAFVSGPSLDALLRQSGPLELDSVRLIVEGIASALDYVNVNGTLHRDVKPSNILLERQDFAYLADFGIASIADRSSLTGAVQPGTEMYASPEQVRSDENLTARSDQFSLACVAYEMLTGSPPFTGDPTRIIRNRATGIITDPIQLRPSLPEDVRTVLFTGLAPQPGGRYSSSASFAHELAQALQGRMSPNRRVRPPHSTTVTKAASRSVAGVSSRVPSRKFVARVAARHYWALDSAGIRAQDDLLWEGGWRFIGHRHAACPQCGRAVAEFSKFRDYTKKKQPRWWRAYFCPCCGEVFSGSELGSGVQYPHDYTVADAQIQ